MFSADLESCHQQVDLSQLIQDEDVCDLGCHSHAVWSVSQSFQPPVRWMLTHKYYSNIIYVYNYYNNH